MTREAEKKWLEANPVYQWRIANHASRSSLAAAAGVSASVLYGAERSGASATTLERIAQVMGSSQEELEMSFLSWLEDNPLLHRSAVPAEGDSE